MIDNVCLRTELPRNCNTLYWNFYQVSLYFSTIRYVSSQNVVIMQKSQYLLAAFRLSVSSVSPTSRLFFMVCQIIVVPMIEQKSIRKRRTVRRVVWQASMPRHPLVPTFVHVGQLEGGHLIGPYWRAKKTSDGAPCIQETPMRSVFLETKDLWLER